MPNSYIDIQTLKASAGLNLPAGTASDAALRRAAEAASRVIDRYCNRVFFTYVEAKEFDGDGSLELFTPDLVSVASVKEDDTMAGTFSVTWGASDFLLYPRSAKPTANYDPRPYTKIIVSPFTSGTQDVFLRGRDNYQVNGTWGFSRVTKTLGVTGTAANATTTSVTLSGSATGNVEIGHTFLLGDEMLYTVGASGTAVTVERGVNGSTATAHTAADVKLLVYPEPVSEACMIETARLWKRKDNAFAAEVGFEGGFQANRGIDPDAARMLLPYRKIAVGL